MVQGPNRAGTAFPSTQSFAPEASETKRLSADQIRCPGVSMLVREGVPVDKDGYVKMGDLADKMKESLGYSEGLAMLISQGGIISATSLPGVKESWREQRINVNDLGKASSNGQHVESLPFRREDGSVDQAALNKALDKYASDGKVSLDDVARMINEYGQSGVVGSEPRGRGIKGKLSQVGKQQTAGEVMLLFAAFAQRDSKGDVYMDRNSFAQAYSGHVPESFVKERDSLGLGTLGKWSTLTATTGSKVVKDEVISGVGSAWNSVKNGITSLFRSEDPVSEGANRALSRGRGSLGGSDQVFGGVAKTGVCPAMPGAANAASTEMTRNPAESAQLHQRTLGQ